MSRTSVLFSAACYLALCGCRPAVASFVPRLELGVTVRQLRASAASEAEQGGRGHLDSTLFLRLSFAPRTDVTALPGPGEASGLALPTHCAQDDLTCLEEAAEAERELAALQEEIP